MKNTIAVSNSNPQLELGFSQNALLLRSEPRKTGRQMACWWFQRMREAVDRAATWTPTPQPRPEQIWLPNTHRSVQLANMGRG